MDMGVLWGIFDCPVLALHPYLLKPVDEPLAALATDFVFLKQTQSHSRNMPTSTQDRSLMLT